MNRIEEDYLELLEEILRFGVEKKDRTLTGTKSVFGRQLRHKMKTGFPLLTTKKMAWKTIVTELLWFLRGDTNIKYLVDNDCHIWDGDAYKAYVNNEETNYERMRSNPVLDIQPLEILSKEEFINKIKTDDEFAKKWGELGPIYGKQWRRWKEQTTNSIIENPYKVGDTNIPGKEIVNFEYIDQIATLINDLKTNPDSRRLMVNAWNVGELDEMVLPPCHYGFQVYTRELSIDERNSIFSERTFISTKGSFAEQNGTLDDYFNKEGIPRRAISLMYNCRSQDLPLGTPYNIASYSLLLMMIAKQVDMVPDELICNLGDCHIYLNQIEGVKEQIDRKPYDLPRLKLSDRKVNDISEYTLDDIILENYQYHPKIYFPLSN